MPAKWQNLISTFDPDGVSISLNFNFLNQQKKRKKAFIVQCSTWERSLWEWGFFLTLLFSFCIRVLTKLHIFPSLSSSPIQKTGQMHEFSWTWLPPSPLPSNICSQRITVSAFTPSSDRVFSHPILWICTMELNVFFLEKVLCPLRRISERSRGLGRMQALLWLWGRGKEGAPHRETLWSWASLRPVPASSGSGKLPKKLQLFGLLFQIPS